MRYAVLTDIHSNREALEAVLADLAARAIDRIAILGDVVGYGPDPVWCCDKVRALVQAGAICIKGNHDHAATGAPEPMNAAAQAAMDWTIRQIGPAERGFLRDLPMTATEGEVLFVHAGAEAPGDWNYVTSDAKATGSFRATTQRVICCGHVHVPLLVSCDLGGMVREQRIPMGAPVPLIRSRRWLAVVGAVGQPRDGVAQAGYAILDTGRNELAFRRVAYDSARTAAKLRAAGLPEPLAVRLIKGR